MHALIHDEHFDLLMLGKIGDHFAPKDNATLLLQTLFFALTQSNIALVFLIRGRAYLVLYLVCIFFL